MRKSIRAVTGLLMVCGLVACDSLWGAFYHCKAGAACDGVDGGIDMAAGDSAWVRETVVGTNWASMSLAPVDNSLWLIGASGEIGFIPSSDMQSGAFSVENAGRVTAPVGDVFKGISACEPNGVSLTAVAISDHSAYKFVRVDRAVTPSAINANYPSDSFNAVVCKRFEDGAFRPFVYMATKSGNDFLKNSTSDFAQAPNQFGVLDAISAVRGVGLDNFWAIRNDSKVARYDGMLSLHSGGAMSGAEKVISSIDSGDSFYLNIVNSVAQTNASNSTFGWQTPNGVVIKNIYAIDSSRVWVAGSNGYVGEFYRVIASTQGTNEYRVPITASLKSIVVRFLPNSGKIVYVISDTGELWRRVFP